jgi:hypothetical protein
MKLMA